MNKENPYHDLQPSKPISREDVYKRIEGLIKNGAPEWEIVYWESEIDRIDRHMLGNLAYDRTRINTSVRK